jgi:hypothetical protein
LTGDPELERLHAELVSYPGVQLEPPPTSPADILVPLRLRVNGDELAFVSTVSTFETAGEITLDELSVEAFYPADAPTANLLLREIAATE